MNQQMPLKWHLEALAAVQKDTKTVKDMIHDWINMKLASSSVFEHTDWQQMLVKSTS